MTKKYKNSNKNKLKNSKSLITFLNKVFLVLIVVLCVSFVISINDLSIKGFMLDELKNKANNLRVENENIELKVTQLKSFENISKKAQELKMVKVDKIDYIGSKEEEVAVK